MDKDELTAIRMILKKTQKQMAQLLGISLRSIQSFEQGWRKISSNIERQAFYLLFLKLTGSDSVSLCWDVENCPPDKRMKCPAWEFNNGHLCWFINGTICQGEPHTSWEKKMDHCRKCKVFMPVIDLILVKKADK